MSLPLIGYVPGEVVARSPEPERVYYSNPDWLHDADGPLLLWDTFGGEFRISLARRREAGWEKVADLEGAMHSHLVHLPDQRLDLILGVDQQTYPRSLVLWWNDAGAGWRGPVELFGGADYHAGSTPWAIYDGRLHVPFEVQGTAQWGSYQYGSVHAALDDDLRRPGSWHLAQSRVPWTVLPGCAPCGALEGNLVVAPDGRLYNFLRIPAYNRLGRAVWEGNRWTWLGLVQGVHNQSKPEIFPSADGSRWYLLANGWPARASSGALPHALRNTLCLWEATEPDLSRWRFLRVIVSDRVPRHAFSYVCGMVDPDDTLWIGERHGDDETHNYHDTNCIVVRSRPGFSAWSEEPVVSPYGHADLTDDGTWVKSDPQDGLLLSHLDGASYPMTLTARFRIEALPEAVGVLDLLGFATCDLVLIAGLQLVHDGQQIGLNLSTGGQRYRQETLTVGQETVTVGQELALELTLLSPARMEARVNQGQPVRIWTHCVSDATLAGVLPRADRPGEPLGRVRVLELPRLVCGDEAQAAPELPSPVILTDGRGITGPLPRAQPTPLANLVPGGPLLAGGDPQALDPWAGGLFSGEGAAAVWSPLDRLPERWSTGGSAWLSAQADDGALILAAIGQRHETRLDNEQPYLALVLQPADDGSHLAIAWACPTDKQITAAPGPVEEWFSYALTVAPAGDGFEAIAWTGRRGDELAEACRVTVPAEALAGARHWLALIGQSDYRVRSFGGLWLSAEALTPEQLQTLLAHGWVTRLDEWPHRHPTCAQPAATATAPKSQASTPFAPDSGGATAAPSPVAPADPPSATLLPDPDIAPTDLPSGEFD